MAEEAKRYVEIIRYCSTGNDGNHCKECPYLNSDTLEKPCVNILFSDAADLIESLSAQLEQVTKERDAAINELVKHEYPIPCESDEFGGSEYCEENCRFKYPQKECWLLYFRELGAEVE